MLNISTERLYFRQWQEQDFEQFAAFFASEENARFVGGVLEPEAAWRLMCSYIGHYNLQGYSYLAVAEKETDHLIGTVGIWNSPPWPEIELGYWLLPEFQGKGYGVEAGLKVKEFAFEKLKVQSLVSYIHPENQPSKKLAIRLGATLEKTIQLLSFGLHEVYRYQ